MRLQKGKVETNKRSETAKLSRYVVVVDQAVCICLDNAKIKPIYNVLSCGEAQANRRIYVSFN